MNRFETILVITCFVLGLSSGVASAHWSLLEDYQLNDIAGNESLCLSSMKMEEECAFEVQTYVTIYPDDDLKDDMDEAREAGVEMIFESFSLEQCTSLPDLTITVEPPVRGDPFFQSDWYTDSSRWEKLWENMFDAPPP